jgi:hypothetical protein
MLKAFILNTNRWMRKIKHVDIGGKNQTMATVFSPPEMCK